MFFSCLCHYFLFLWSNKTSIFWPIISNETGNNPALSRLVCCLSVAIMLHKLVSCQYPDILILDRSTTRKYKVGSSYTNWWYHSHTDQRYLGQSLFYILVWRYLDVNVNGKFVCIFMRMWSAECPLSITDLWSAQLLGRHHCPFWLQQPRWQQQGTGGYRGYRQHPDRTSWNCIGDEVDIICKGKGLLKAKNKKNFMYGQDIGYLCHTYVT